MPTGIQLSSGVVVGQPIPLDAKFGPYNSTAAALNDIGVGLRYRGLTVGVYVSGDLDPGQSGQGPSDPVLTEYWFKDGTGNEHFVAKSSDVTWDSVLNKPATFTPSTHSHPNAFPSEVLATYTVGQQPSELGPSGGLTSTAIYLSPDYSSGTPIPAPVVGTVLRLNREQVVVTSVAPVSSYPTGTITIARAINGTQAATHAVGSSIYVLPTNAAAGFLSAADKAKLDGIASGAEVNVNADWTASSGDAQILNKPSTFAPSAHTHPTSEITDFSTQAISALYGGIIPLNAGLPVVTRQDGGIANGFFGTSAGTFCAGNDARLSDPRTPTAHTHPISDVTDLQTALNGKAAFSHTHPASQITSFPIELVIACSDETSHLTTGTAKVTFRAPYAFALTAVRASVNTAPTSGTLVVDINGGGSTVLSTKLSIDADEKTSTTAATAAVISNSAIADDAEITIDIVQGIAGQMGKGLKVVLIGTRS